ncbi:MAG: hypothetical protein LBF22_02590 [Deltaproteobacteria bacterium]|nr:hypothetical protein [Deltaproteobacteria bacterium]
MALILIVFKLLVFPPWNLSHDYMTLSAVLIDFTEIWQSSDYVTDLWHLSSSSLSNLVR